MEVFFETERLLAVRIAMDDLPLIFETGQDPEIVKYIHQGKILTWEEEKERLEERIAYYEQYPGMGVFKMLDKEKQEFVGNCNLNHLDTTGLIQIGYRLAKKHWGKGYATEIARGLLDYGFRTIGLDRINAVTEEGNAASQKVLKKAGMIYQGMLENGDILLHHFLLKKEEYEASLLKNTP